MSVPKEETNKKYLMDKIILSILRRAPKRGIWMKEFAEELNISRPLLNYYLFGMHKKGNISGGRLKTMIIIRREGNNRFVSIKERQ